VQASLAAGHVLCKYDRQDAYPTVFETQRLDFVLADGHDAWAENATTGLPTQARPANITLLMETSPVLLSEPSTTDFDLRFAILGIPVRIHPMFWLAGLILGSSGDALSIVMWMLVLLVSILVHELGHSLMMRRYGISSHIVLYMMGGLAIPDSFGSWRGTSPRDTILIAAAGPGAGFLLAGLVVLLIIATGGVFGLHGQFPFFHFALASSMPLEGPSPLEMLVADLLWVNIFWGLINLVPVFPLDGGQIARQVLVMWNPWQGATQALWLSVIAGGAMAVVGFMLQSFFMAILFGMLAVQSYFAIQQLGGGGFGGGRPW
jgi:Zn-dependent protease